MNGIIPNGNILLHIFVATPAFLLRCCPFLIEIKTPGYPEKTSVQPDKGYPIWPGCTCIQPDKGIRLSHLAREDRCTAR